MGECMFKNDRGVLCPECEVGQLFVTLGSSTIIRDMDFEEETFDYMLEPVEAVDSPEKVWCVNCEKEWDLSDGFERCQFWTLMKERAKGENNE